MDSRIFARLSPEMMEELQYMIDHGMVKSMSEAVITAVSEFISSRLSDEDREALKNNPPEDDYIPIPDIPQSKLREIVYRHNGVTDDK